LRKLKKRYEAVVTEYIYVESQGKYIPNHYVSIGVVKEDDAKRIEQIIETNSVGQIEDKDLEGDEIEV